MPKALMEAINLTNILVDGLTYVANGSLLLVYLLVGNLPAIMSLASAGFIFLVLDSEVQRRAGFRPLRGGPMGQPDLPERRGMLAQAMTDQRSAGPQPRTAQVLTGIVFALWLIAQTGMAAPVPWIGAVMWLVGVIVLLVMPDHQRFNQLWFVKTGLAVYALLVIGSRIYLGYATQLSPEQWAGIIGSAESASAIIASTKGNVTTIILWALWLVAPLGYFSLLVQQVFVNPMNLVSPLAGAQDVLKRIRERV
ncbi:MAG TPA: hypothetical protein PKM01_04805 [Anaerolineaceae bacterium]|nr:hypothetical protein [Anaerolineaceae bacterium]